MKNKGITLISLVITIIILIILASITTYTGVSTIKSSKFTKFKTELEIMQAQVNLLYEKYTTAPDEEKEQYLNMGEELTGTEEEKQSFKGAGEVEKSGYRYFTKETLEIIDEKGLEYEYLVNIKERKVIALDGFEYERKIYYTLSQVKGETAKVGGLEREENIAIESISYQKSSGNKFKITLENIQCSKYVGKYEVKYKEINDKSYKTAATEATGKDFTFEVNKYGIYYIKVTDAAGKTTRRPEIIVSVYANQTFDNTDREKITMVKEITDIGIKTAEVAIPKGFTMSGVDSECAQTILGTTIEKRYTIDDGVVTYMLNGADVNWRDAISVDTAQKTYDQFVWVPVNNPVLDLSGNITALSSDSNIKAAVQKEINSGRYPMAIKKANGDYFGILYEFSLDNTINSVKVEPYSSWTPLSLTNNGEPITLVSVDSLTNLEQINGILGTRYNDETTFGTALQIQYNEMVEKVILNKGFWVGRYETSNMTNSNTPTQRIRIIKGTRTGIDNVTWYRMYAQQINYIKLANYETQFYSSMIWGSQWDQIMIWMKDVKNVNKNSYYVINSQEMANYATSVGGEGIIVDTGYYSVKNIYDLAGNVDEWTLEAINNKNRTNRRRRLSYS